MNKIQHIRDEIVRHETALTKLLDKVEKLALDSGDTKISAFIAKERKKVNGTLAKISTCSADLLPSFQQELKKRTKRLEAKVSTLNKAKDALVSNNYLLEYKKNDLLVLTTKLEDAYEEISLKNKELTEKQQMIQEQAETLNAVYEEMITKNEELIAQKEALLDQSDYLHDANQTITHMHREVELQKDEILRKNEELLNLNNEKNNLIGIVAHDLKSPLNQIRGLLSLLKQTISDRSEETMSFINMMETSSEKLSEMIGKILDVEAIESKQLNLRIEELPMAKMIGALADRYELAAGEKQIVIHRDLPEGLHAVADSGYTEQVCENLLSNAIKFSPGNRHVFLNLSASDGRIILEVRDEGPGLTDSDKAKLFGKYQKLSARPTGNETSTGLGLSIVKKFVEAMGGQIWCESEAGKGASFFVSFPAKAV